jgi:hypothetical protein
LHSPAERNIFVQGLKLSPFAHCLSLCVISTHVHANTVPAQESVRSVIAMSETFDLATAVAAGAGPLEFTFPLSPSATVVTSVFGDARNSASVTIMSGSMPVWNGSMNQVSPNAVVPYELKLGSLNIKAGMRFTLTIPSTQQMGNVLMMGEVQTPPNDWQPISAFVAMWPLTSTT